MADPLCVVCFGRFFCFASSIVPMFCTQQRKSQNDSEASPRRVPRDENGIQYHAAIFGGDASCLRQFVSRRSKGFSTALTLTTASSRAASRAALSLDARRLFWVTSSMTECVVECQKTMRGKKSQPPFIPFAHHTEIRSSKPFLSISISARAFPLGLLSCPGLP